MMEPEDRDEQEQNGGSGDNGNGEEGLSDIQRALMGDTGAVGGDEDREESAPETSGETPVQDDPRQPEAEEEPEPESTTAGGDFGPTSVEDIAGGEEESAPPEGGTPDQQRRGGTMYCYNHPENEATFQCPECNIYYCNEEATLWKGTLLCDECAGEKESQYVAEQDLVPGVDYDPDDPDKMFEDEVPDFDPAAGDSAGKVASPLRRAIQGGLDLAFSRIIVLVVYLFVMAQGGGQFVWSTHLNDFWQGITSPSGLLLVTLAVDYIYFSVWLILVNRTPGMWMANLRVCSDFGDFLGPGEVLLRTLIQVPTLGLGLIVSPFLSTRQSLHDIPVNSVVINYSGVRAVDPADRVQVKTV